MNGDSIEIEGTWSGVQWIAIALLVLLPLVARSPLGLAMVSAGAVAVFVFPARRRVVFDGKRQILRIDHAGFFREPWAREVPFSDVRLVLQRAGRKGGRPVFRAFARTASERVYLFSHAGEAGAAALDRDIRGVLPNPV